MCSYLSGISGPLTTVDSEHGRGRNLKANLGQNRGVRRKGAAGAKQSYIVGVGFNAWSLANIVAATKEKDLFPDITSRAKASKERKVAMQLFDVFRPVQKAQKIKDEDLAKLAGADLTGLKPVLDYYDALPKK